jgi:hypothetical protein
MKGGGRVHAVLNAPRGTSLTAERYLKQVPQTVARRYDVAALSSVRSGS